MAINIASTYEDVIIEVKDNPVVVHFNSAGVSGMGPKLLKICRMCIPELEDLSSFCVTSSEWADEDFKITIEYSQSGGLMVKKTNAPKK